MTNSNKKIQAVVLGGVVLIGIALYLTSGFSTTVEFPNTTVQSL